TAGIREQPRVVVRERQEPELLQAAPEPRADDVALPRRERDPRVRVDEATQEIELLVGDDEVGIQAVAPTSGSRGGPGFTPGPERGGLGGGVWRPPPARSGLTC